jgi:hypothetical protein
MCHFRFISLGVNPLPESFQAIRWKIYAEEKTKRIKTNNKNRSNSSNFAPPFIYCTTQTVTSSQTMKLAPEPEMSL